MHTFEWLTAHQTKPNTPAIVCRSKQSPEHFHSLCCDCLTPSLMCPHVHSELKPARHASIFNQRRWINSTSEQSKVTHCGSHQSFSIWEQLKVWFPWEADLPADSSNGGGGWAWRRTNPTECLAACTKSYPQTASISSEARLILRVWKRKQQHCTSYKTCATV